MSKVDEFGLTADELREIDSWKRRESRRRLVDVAKKYAVPFLFAANVFVWSTYFWIVIIRSVWGQK